MNSENNDLNNNGGPQLPPPPPWIEQKTQPTKPQADGFSNVLPNQPDLLSQFQQSSKAEQQADKLPPAPSMPSGEFNIPIPQAPPAQPQVSSEPSFSSQSHEPDRFATSRFGQSEDDKFMPPPPPGELAAPHPSFGQKNQPKQEKKTQPTTNLAENQRKQEKKQEEPKKKKRGGIRPVQGALMIVVLAALFFCYGIIRDARTGSEAASQAKTKQMDFETRIPTNWTEQKQDNVEGSKSRYFYGTKNDKVHGMFVTQSELEKEANIDQPKFQNEVERKLLLTGASKLKKRNNLKIGDKKALVYSFKTKNTKIETGFVVDKKKQWQFSCQYNNKTTKQKCQNFLNNIKW